MKTLVKKSHVETGDLKVNKFKGKLNAKAFRLLTDNIYSDKIKALVRELSTNANDSEKEAGNIGKFEVHLPTNLEPYFYIRDYGTGMSPEMIVETYTVFFESTKDDSNEFTGCLGLGSKTPLHYNTKSCTVNSWHNGMHYIYSCFMGNDGCPAYVELSRQESTEPNGVKVEFPVNKGDIESFYDRAKEVYKWFEFKPRFIGKQIEIPNVEYTISNDSWKLYSGKAGVLMGNILYPIEEGKNKDLDKYNALIRSGLILIANIGDVEFDMSREHLSYSPYTVKYLVRAFEKVQEEYIKTIQSSIDKCESYFGAQKKFSEISRNKLTNIFGVKCGHITFNGLKLTESLDYKKLLCSAYVRNTHNKSLRSRKSEYARNPIPVNSNLLLVVNDQKVGCISKISRYIDSLSNEHYTAFNVLIFQDKEVLKTQLNCTDDDIILVSTLPKLEPKQRYGVKRGTIANWPVYYPSKQISQRWIDKNIDISKPGYYILRDAYKVIIDNCAVDSSGLDRIRETLSVVGENVDVIGCSKKNEAILIKHGWTNIQSRAEEVKLSPKYKSIYINQLLKTHIEQKHRKLIVSSYSGEMIKRNLWVIKTIDNSLCNLIKELKENLLSIENSFKSNTSHNFYGGLYTEELNALKIAEDAKINYTLLLLDRVAKKYPLFNAVEFNKMSVSLLTPYITGIQNVSGKN